MSIINPTSSVRQAAAATYAKQKQLFEQARAGNVTKLSEGVQDRVTFSDFFNQALGSNGVLPSKLRSAEQAASQSVFKQLDPVSITTRLDKAMMTLDLIKEIRNRMVDAVKKIYESPI